jgi:arylsulfatase A-like enzyme
MRVPAIFWWPGTVRRGVVPGIGSNMDLFVTAIRLAGGKLPTDRPIDGVDLSKTLLRGTESPRHLLYYYWDDELRAIRKDAFKAHFITSGVYGVGAPRTTHNPPLLFNIAEDPGERFNIAEKHPDIVADILRESEAHRKTIIMNRPLFDESLPTR